MARKLLRMTQDDIDTGLPKMCGECPIAQTLKREYPDAVYIQVSFDNVRASRDYLPIVSNGDMFLNSRCSKRMQRFIRAFDTGNPVKPINFYVTE